MPAIYERKFAVRAYECDAYGHVNHANYLRYMQEAAIEASASVGYDTAEYERLGTTWLIRDTEIEYEKPLFYGDHLTVRTWVDDFRRIRSRRMYAFERAGEAVARASTDWVYLDRHTLRPARIPAEMGAAFCPDGCKGAAGPLPSLALPDAPPEIIHSMRRDVAWRDLDSVGHVNNAVYLSYCEDAGLDAARRTGWALSEMFSGEWGIFTRRNRIAYLQPALLGDRIETRTWLSQPGNTSIRRYFSIRRAEDGTELVRAEFVWVIVRLTDQRPIPIPESFLARFGWNMS